MFGSRHCLPHPHTGCHLVLRKEDKDFIFQSEQILSGDPHDQIAYAAFFSDGEHEVLPVTSGHRITLTYNLYQAKKMDTISLLVSEYSIMPLRRAFSEALSKPDFMPNGGYVGFHPHHEYPIIPGKTEFCELEELLKGEDLVLRSACEALGLVFSIYAVIDEFLNFTEGPGDQVLLERVENTSSWGEIHRDYKRPYRGKPGGRSLRVMFCLCSKSPR